MSAHPRSAHARSCQSRPLSVKIKPPLKIRSAISKTWQKNSFKYFKSYSCMTTEKHSQPTCNFWLSTKTAEKSQVTAGTSILPMSHLFLLAQKQNCASKKTKKTNPPSKQSFHNKSYVHKIFHLQLLRR